MSMFKNIALAIGESAGHFGNDAAKVIAHVRANPAEAAKLLKPGTAAREEYELALRQLPEQTLDYSNFGKEFNAQASALKREAVLNPKSAAGLMTMPMAGGAAQQGLDNPATTIGNAINDYAVQPVVGAIQQGLNAYDQYVAKPIQNAFIEGQEQVFQQAPGSLKSDPLYSGIVEHGIDPMNAIPFAEGGEVPFDPDAWLASYKTSPVAASKINQSQQPQVLSGLEPDAFDPDAFLHQMDQEQYGTPEGMLKTAAEGAAQGLVGPLAPLIETKVLGVNPEDIRKRAEVNPGTHTAFELGGLGAGMLTGTGEAALMSEAGTAASKALGFTAEANYAHKIGSAVVSQAVENAIYQSGDEISKRILQDPTTSAESAISNIGLAAALGGAAGGFISGAVHPLWKATVGDRLENTLGGLARRLNGEGDQALVQEARALGVNLSPEVEGAMSSDPFIKKQSSTLMQQDTTSAGRSYQESLTQFRNETSDAIGEALGRTRKEIENFDLNKYESGKSIGDALAAEYKTKIDPIIKELDTAKAKFADKELPKGSIERIVDPNNPYTLGGIERVRPGFTDVLSERISEVAATEGWLSRLSSEEARMVRGVLKDLKSTDTLGKLVKLGQNVGQSTKSVLPFGQQTPLSRAGQMVKELIHGTENSFVAESLGKTQGPEAFLKYSEALDRFKEVAKIKDALNDRLKVNGSVSGFAKGLTEMAKTDAETLLNRINGASDANGLQFLSEHFPEAAQKLRQYHIDQLIDKATKGNLGEGNILSQKKLMSAIDGMSPQLKEFAFTPDQLTRIQGLNNLVEKLNYSTHNFSNTARTVDKLTQHMGSTSLSAVAAITGHQIGAIAALIAPTFIKEGHAATRLGLLKWLGSNQPINASGFKAMVSYLNASIKGETQIMRATKAVFKSGVSVLSPDQMPSKADNEKVDKKVIELQDSPNIMLRLMKGDTSHYLPEHQTELVKTTTNALNYLQTIKPQPKKLGPLDKEMPAAPAALARYNRALSIANNPVYVLQQVKSGTLASTDLQDLKNLYPGVYNRMSQELSNNMIETHSKDELIPYQVKMGTSLFLGQPVDYSMRPESIQAAQTAIKPAIAQQSAPKSGNFSKLGNYATPYKTPGQSAQADRAAHSDE